MSLNNELIKLPLILSNESTCDQLCSDGNTYSGIYQDQQFKLVDINNSNLHFINCNTEDFLECTYLLEQGVIDLIHLPIPLYQVENKMIFDSTPEFITTSETIFTRKYGYAQYPEEYINQSFQTQFTNEIWTYLLIAVLFLSLVQTQIVINTKSQEEEKENDSILNKLIGQELKNKLVKGLNWYAQIQFIIINQFKVLVDLIFYNSTPKIKDNVSFKTLEFLLLILKIKLIYEQFYHQALNIRAYTGQNKYQNYQTWNDHLNYNIEPICIPIDLEDYIQLYQPNLKQSTQDFKDQDNHNCEYNSKIVPMESYFRSYIIKQWGCGLQIEPQSLFIIDYVQLISSSVANKFIYSIIQSQFYLQDQFNKIKNDYCESNDQLIMDPNYDLKTLNFNDVRLYFYSVLILSLFIWLQNMYNDIRRCLNKEESTINEENENINNQSFNDKQKDSKGKLNTIFKDQNDSAIKQFTKDETVVCLDFDNSNINTKVNDSFKDEDKTHKKINSKNAKLNVKKNIKKQVKKEIVKKGILSTNKKKINNDEYEDIEDDEKSKSNVKNTKGLSEKKVKLTASSKNSAVKNKNI